MKCCLDLTVDYEGSAGSVSTDVGKPSNGICEWLQLLLRTNQSKFRLVRTLITKPDVEVLLPQQTTSPSLAAPSNVCAVVSEENVLSVDWEHVGGGKDKTYNVYLQKRYAASAWQKLNHSPLTLKEYTHFNSVYKDSEYSVSVITISGNVESDYTECNFRGNSLEDK